MHLLHAFFEVIGILIGILITLFFLLGMTDLIDVSIRIGPPGQNAKIRKALDKE